VGAALFGYAIVIAAILFKFPPAHLCRAIPDLAAACTAKWSQTEIEQTQRIKAQTTDYMAFGTP
jgi:hypothetical protein